MPRVRLSLLAVALLCAAVADPSVESIANLGWFGPAYRDHNHLGVFPTLCFGGMLALVALFGRLRDLLEHHSAARRSPVVDLAISLARSNWVRLLPLLIALELATVLAMECAEAVATGAPLPLPLAWLGAPVLVALAAHALCVAAALFVLARFGRALLSAIAHFIRRAIAWWMHLRPCEPGRYAANLSFAPAFSSRLLLRTSGERSPPQAVRI
jgi:hypothetical protein